MDGNLLRLYRDRVCEFESEITSKLAQLTQVEADLLRLSQLRQHWLRDVSDVDKFDGETFTKKLQVLKRQATLQQQNLMLDVLRLEGFQENQTLEYLTQATRPFEEGETKEQRAREMAAVVMENLQNLKVTLHKSNDYRAKLVSHIYDLSLELSKIKIEYTTQHSNLIAGLKDRVVQYLTNMRESVTSSSENHKRITGDYLVLRHNARVAQEVLLRSQKEAANARRDLQSKLDKLVEEATMQRERIETVSNEELRLQTDSIRSQVILKERELSELETRTHSYTTARKDATRKLKKELKRYNAKYDDLQEKRKADLKRMNDELRGLRSLIGECEAKLHDETV